MVAAGSGGSTGGAGAGGAGAGQAGTAGQPAKSEPVPPKPLWLAPELIDVGSGDVQLSMVSFNLAGDLATSWWQEDATGFLWLRRFVNGAWEQRPYAVSQDTIKPTDKWPPWVGIDGTGKAHLLFSGTSPGSDGLMSTMYWTSWTGANDVMLDTVDPGFGNIVGIPALLAVTEAGASTAVWMSARTTVGASLYMSTRRAATWDTPRRILPGIAVETLSSGASNFSGGFVVTNAIPGTGGSNGSFSAVVRKDDTITTSPMLDFPEQFQSEGFCTMDPVGNATAVFILVDGTNTPHAYFTRYTDASKVWSPIARVSDNVVPRLALALVGSDAIFLWHEPIDAANPAVGRFVARRYSDDKGWRAPEVISSELTVDGPFDGSMSDTATGAIALAFSHRTRASDGSETRVLSALRATPANGWGQIETVATYSGEIRIRAVNVTKDGRAMIVWEHAEPGSVHHLKSSRSL